MLEPLGGPCIFAIDETDAIFQTSFSQDFFSMLRSWHNRRADPIRRCWKKLDIILSTSTEPQFFIDRPHESPFNVGVTLRVEDFNPEQVGVLNARHPRPLSGGDVERLYRLVRGHPFLTRKALYMAAGSAPTCSVDELFAHARDDAGPFGDHLRDYLLRLQRKQDLIPALRQVDRRPYAERRAGDLPAAGARPGAARRPQGGAALRALRRVFPRAPPQRCLTPYSSSPAAPSRRVAASIWSATRTATCSGTVSPETSPTS